MALVLYHVEDAAKEKQLSALCRELHLTARRLTNADRDRAVAALCGEQSVLPLFSEDFLSPAFDFRHRSGAGKCKKEQSICWTSSL